MEDVAGLAVQLHFQVRTFSELMKNIVDIFDHSTENRKPTPGSLLVAEPFLHESFFERAVIALVTLSDTKGCMGIVLGNRSDSTLGDLLPEERHLGLAAECPVFIGGPMGEDRLFAIHTLGNQFDPEGHFLGNGLWLSSDIDTVIEAAGAGGADIGAFRFFNGYSGWTAGQLEEEIDNNVWALTDPDHQLDGQKLLTLDGDRQWQYAVRSLGQRHRHWLLHPRTPQSN